MSTNNNININESPSHFIVLDAVSRGNNTVEKISRAAKLDKNQVELLVNDLVQQRLVNSAEKKGSFLSSLLGGGRTKVVLNITNTGLRLLDVKKQELEQKASQLRQWYNNGDTSPTESQMAAESGAGGEAAEGGSETTSETGSQDAGSGGEVADTSDTGGMGDFGGFDGGGFGDF